MEDDDDLLLVPSHFDGGDRLDRITIRFRTGRPMRFGVWGRTRDPIDSARGALAPSSVLR